MLFFRRGDLYESRQRIGLALELAPGLIDAREVSGDLHYQEGQLDPALSGWEAALSGAGPREHPLRETRPCPEAFRDASGIDLPEFEERWVLAQR